MLKIDVISLLYYFPFRNTSMHKKSTFSIFNKFRKICNVFSCLQLHFGIMLYQNVVMITDLFARQPQIRPHC